MGLVGYSQECRAKGIVINILNSCHFGKFGLLFPSTPRYLREDPLTMGAGGLKNLWGDHRNLLLLFRGDHKISGVSNRGDHKINFDRGFRN